jgi:hypothetical protein
VSRKKYEARNFLTDFIFYKPFKFKNHMKKIILSMAAVAALMFTACQKDGSVETTTVTELATISGEDVSDIESATQSTEDELDDVLTENGLTVRSCKPTLTFSAPKGTYPQTITLTFDGNCNDQHSRKRKGQIVITLSDSLTKTGATKTVTYNNFYLDSVKIEGTRKWTNTGKNAQGQPTFKREATNMKLTFADGTTATWTATHVVTKTQGFDTPRVMADDVWAVTGNTEGVNRKGKSYKSVISSPIVHKAICPWITKGVRTVTVEDKTFSLDYSHGGGDCDREALLTLENGTTKVIRIRK